MVFNDLSLGNTGTNETSTFLFLTSRAQVKNLLIGMKGQMDWPRPGAQMLVLEEPSGACIYAFVEKPVRAQHPAQSVWEAAVRGRLVSSASRCYRKVLIGRRKNSPVTFFSLVLVFKNKQTCFDSEKTRQRN